MSVHIKMILMLVVSIILLSWALFMLMTSPAAAAACLTKSEARSLYPGKALYWHGANRCWDATRPTLVHFVQTKRPVPTAELKPLPVYEIKDAPTFTPWDDRIGIPTTKP